MAQVAATLRGIISRQFLPTIDGMGRVLAAEVLVPTSAVRIRHGAEAAFDLDELMSLLH